MKYKVILIAHTVVICSAIAAIVCFSELSSIDKPVSDLIGAAIFVPFASVFMVAINIKFNRAKKKKTYEVESIISDEASQAQDRTGAFLDVRLPARFMKLRTRTSFVAILGGIFIVSLSFAPLWLRILLFAILCLYQIVTFYRFESAPCESDERRRWM
ncbi:hypothetical protein O1R50_06635 [Glycomyces luteolus]|uniref:Uncharacterized protein n=1 Tax=Glycomyces luteolus TaxID=2670330 RepID=A0A9X3P723_9ACTN|nr:hypothetical protein [Glycomyces luteolus]MDA1359289.1 hypothetical protein [Glycomyces luteolus]